MCHFFAKIGEVMQIVFVSFGKSYRAEAKTCEQLPCWSQRLPNLSVIIAVFLQNLADSKDLPEEIQQQAISRPIERLAIQSLLSITSVSLKSSLPPTSFLCASPTKSHCAKMKTSAFTLCNIFLTPFSLRSVVELLNWCFFTDNVLHLSISLRSIVFNLYVYS